MADDAMDWHPTTPPVPHNPYPDPRYIPGGWPITPQPNDQTSGVFARKRPSTFFERAAKRVRTGFTNIGKLATLPVKPIYLIVRHLRNRRRNNSHRPRRDPAQNRRNSPALRARVAAAERLLDAQHAASLPQHIITPPSTPEQRHELAICSGALGEDPDHLQSPAATSVTNTETTVSTPASTRSAIDNGSYTAIRTGRKRLRSVGQEAAVVDNNQHSTLQSYLASTATQQLPTPEPEESLNTKRMRGSNRFDAGYRRTTSTHKGKGTASLHVKPIGTRVESSDHLNKLFGGWEHEVPLGITPPSPDPSVSPPINDEPQVAPYSTSTRQLAAVKDTTFKHKHEATHPESHDERWSSDYVLNVFFPEDYGLDGPDSENEQADHDGRAIKPAEESASEVNLFDGRRLRNIPSIKPRLIPSASHVRKQQQATVAEDPAPREDVKTAISPKHEDVNSVIKHGTEVSTQVLTTSDVVKTEVDREPTLDNIATTSETIAAVSPATPLKVVAKQPAEQAIKTPVAKALEIKFETPADQLSKLDINDGEDSDTPKASPHFGTKTNRITRYREALEKAQKAKLEQYELVPISREWDRKVQAAVRSGIPDYLGPRDLARVVPQYAPRGQDNWLNDETINKYLELVATHGRKNDRPEQVRSHHAFNNFFYNNLRDKGPATVIRWSKRAKIGGKNLAYVEKVFVPINSGAHWTLAVVEPTQKRITHYNSMRGAGIGIRACEDLKKWVALELGNDFEEDEWTLTSVGESPQQTNCDDCGIFTITSARQIMLGLTPMSYRAAQIPDQRIRIVAELINQGLLKSAHET